MGVFSTSICLFLPILAPKLAQAGRPMGPAKLFWAGGWSDHPSPSLHSKIFEKSKIDASNWYLYSWTLCLENVIKEIFQVFEVTIHFFSLYLAANINAQIQNV